MKSLAWGVFALVGVSHAASTVDLAPLVAAEQAQVIAWRRDIHEHPELSNREVRTSALVADHLKSLGLEVAVYANTGVVGLLRGGKPGPTVALRADMDALPVAELTQLPFMSHATSTYRGETVGVMHACGHDTHTAMLMGVADILVKVRGGLKGNVLFLFQPAEEGAPEGEEGGAALMLKQGVFDKYHPQAVFGLHVVSALQVGQIGYRPGPMMAGADGYKILVHGRSTHGARPWEGVDPIVIAAQIVGAMQTVVSRQLDITAHPAIVSVGAIKGGIRDNIIPATVEMVGTIRTFDLAQRDVILDHLKHLVENTAIAGGATATFEVGQDSYPVLVNDPALTQRMLPTLKAVAGDAHLMMLPLITASEDFAFFARKVPGMYINIGITPLDKDPATAPPNHSPLFYVDETGLPTGVRVMAQLAVDYLR
ncbi:MAG TPA: amidohydrolase [Steroidobacteraceae bacterium]|nr:amidohydrolase [Steroidobacteraceae bacterium]